MKMKKYLIGTTHRTQTSNNFNTIDSTNLNNTLNTLSLNSFSMKFRKTNKMKLNLPIKHNIAQSTTISGCFNTISETMSKYSMAETKKKNNQIPPSLNISKEEKREISKYFCKSPSPKRYSKQKIRRSKIELNNDCDLKIDVNNRLTFFNPYNSLGIIKMNKQIYESVNQCVEDQQITSYNQSIKEIEDYNKVHTTKMPKIRVTPMIPNGLSDYKKPLNQNKEEELFGYKILNPNVENKLFCYYFYPLKTFPGVREHCTLAKYLNYYYLYGGIGSIISSTNTLWKLDILSLEWEKVINPLEQNQAQLYTVPQSRFGHTAECFQNIMYIIGGRTKYMNSYVLSDLDFYDVSKCHFIDKSFLCRDRWQFRYNHISHLVGTQIIVHGGLDEENKILNHCFIINLTPFKLVYCSVDINHPAPYLHGHCSAMAIPCETLNNLRMTVHKYPEVSFGKTVNLKLKEKGWYIFGGRTNKNKLSNDLYLATIGQKPLKFLLKETNGKKPSPRYDATMNFYEKGNHLILFGGRNDAISDSYALNDLYILDLFSFDWIFVKLYNTDPRMKVVKRCGHCTILYDDKLFVFGGMNSGSFVGSALFVVDLNFDYEPSEERKRLFLIDRSAPNYKANFALRNQLALDFDEGKLRLPVITE